MPEYTRKKARHPVLNKTLSFITGCLRLTPTAFLPVLSGMIAPTTIHREHHTHRLVNMALLDPTHLLRNLILESHQLGRKCLPFIPSCSSPAQLCTQQPMIMENKLAIDPRLTQLTQSYHREQTFIKWTGWAGTDYGQESTGSTQTHISLGNAPICSLDIHYNL